MNNSIRISLRYSLLFIALAVLVPAKAQEFRRAIEYKTFVPKGQWVAGCSASFSDYKQDNYQLLIIDGMNGDGYTFKVSPLLLYAFKDNMAAGGRLSYGRSLTKLQGVTINLDDENQFDLSDLYNLTHSFTVSAVGRSYLNLGNSRRFGVFYDLQLEYTGSQSKAVSGSGDDVTGTFAETKKFGLGVAPGIVAFVNNYMAVELNVGVLGVNFGKTRQTTNQVYLAEQSSSSGSFRINLFSIGFGVAFYL